MKCSACKYVNKEHPESIVRDAIYVVDEGGYYSKYCKECTTDFVHVDYSDMYYRLVGIITDVPRLITSIRDPRYGELGRLYHKTVTEGHGSPNEHNRLDELIKVLSLK